MDISDKLKNIRLESKLSISRLAELTGISKSYLSDIESKKKTKIGADIIKKLSTFFNVAPTYFMSDGELSDEETTGMKMLKNLISKSNENEHILKVYSKYKDDITPEDLDDILRVVVRSRKQRQEDK